MTDEILEAGRKPTLISTWLSIRVIPLVVGSNCLIMAVSAFGDVTCATVLELPYGTFEFDCQIQTYVKGRLSAQLGYTDLEFHILSHHAACSVLQNQYALVLGQPRDQGSFRRSLLPAEFGESTGRDQSNEPATDFALSCSRLISSSRLTGAGRT